MNKIKVFGHKNPDLDSVASAFAASYMLNTRDEIIYEPCLLGQINKEAKYVVDTYGINLNMEIIKKVENDEAVVLVDHNEFTQSVDNIENADIKIVIDHHKIDNFRTKNPVEFTARTVGCTCTIIYGMLKEMNKLDNRDVNILMLAAILSDTLILKSPTTTKTDIKVVKELSTLLNINYEELGFNLLKAGADLSDLTKEQLIKVDSKIFETNRIENRN